MSRPTEALDSPFPAAPTFAEPPWAVFQDASLGARGSALALLSIATYLPALASGFVWDDWIFVTEPLVRRWDGLVSIWLSPADIRGEDHYWPIVYTSFWLEHKLWGFHAAGYHATNLLLHALNTLLVWRLLLRLEIPGAWLAGALFAVHPVHVESVAWIIERKDLLSALFYLWAVHVWLRYTETLAMRHLALCLALFTAAMLSKSIAVTLPAALLLLTWWRTGKVTLRDVGRLLPFFAVAAGVTAADLFFYWSGDRYPLDYSLPERVLIAARALWLYAGQLAWPASLPIFYPRWDVEANDPSGWAAVTAICALFAALWLGRRHLSRGPFAALAFFAVSLSPVLGFVDFGFMHIAFLADRFQYLASIGPTALAASALAQSMTRLRRKGHVAAVGVIVGALATLCSLTWRQAEIYRDELTFARHISTANPTHYYGQIFLGLNLIGVGRHEEALTAAENAVHLAEGQREADVAAAVATAGMALLADDRPAQAEESLRRAVVIQPEYSGARMQLARTLVAQARYDEGLELYRELARKDPLSDIAYLGQAEAMLRAGNLPAAKDAFLRALRLVRDPRTEPAIHRRLGEVLHRLREIDAAAEHLDRSLELNPRSIPALLARAAVEVERAAVGADSEESRASQPDLERDVRTTESAGDTPDKWIRKAREIVEAGIKRGPERADVRILLATILHRQGEHRKAMIELETALAANPNRPTTRQVHRLMGEILEALNQHDQAQDHYGAALAIYPLDADALERLAAIHFQAGLYAKALPLYHSLAEVAPCNIKNLSRLIETRTRLNLPTKATQASPNRTVTAQTVKTAYREPLKLCRPPASPAGTGYG